MEDPKVARTHTSISDDDSNNASPTSTESSLRIVGLVEGGAPQTNFCSKRRVLWVSSILLVGSSLIAIILIVISSVSTEQFRPTVLPPPAPSNTTLVKPQLPTESPVSLFPTRAPIEQSALPTLTPATLPSAQPSSTPSQATPSNAPSLLRRPSSLPSHLPSPNPTMAPTNKNECPTHHPVAPLSGKKGVGFTLRPAGQKGNWIENLPKVHALRPHWNYRWGLERIDAQSQSIEFLPMLWGGRDKDSTTLQQKLKEQVLPYIASGQVKRILGFNEPDVLAQANMSVERALEIWPLLEALNIPLISPSCGHADGVWMEEFMANITANCQRVDWIGVHWYGSASVTELQNKLQAIHQKFERPIIVTEFAPADWKAETPETNKHSKQAVLAFAKKILPWMEAQDWIVGYAWFPFPITSPQGSSSALFDEGARLTALGRYYASVRADNPTGDQTIEIE